MIVDYVNPKIGFTQTEFLFNLFGQKTFINEKNNAILHFVFPIKYTILNTLLEWR